MPKWIRLIHLVVLKPLKDKWPCSCCECLLTYFYIPCLPCAPCFLDCYPDCAPNDSNGCCDGVCRNCSCSCYCPCTEPNRSCCGICPKSSCPCTDPNRSCCGICPKPSCPCSGSNGCCCCGICSCSNGSCCCSDTSCQIYEYCSKIYDSNDVLKYYVFLDYKRKCGCKCLRRKTGLNFNICDINKNVISTIRGKNKNEEYGLFFDDSYSYEINFPSDATPELKLNLLHCIYSIDALCVY